jgi:hypothetical protein
MLQQPRQPKRLDPRRRQLNRQRHPVQPRHQPRRQRPGLAGQSEMRIGQPGSVREWGHRLGLARPRSTAVTVQRQRRQAEPGLPGQAQRLPAGRQHPHIIRGR